MTIREPITSEKPKDVNKLWKAVMAELQIILSPYYFNTWLSKTKAQNLTEDSLEIVCPSDHSKSYIQNSLSIIQESINKIGKGKYKLIFIVEQPEIKEQDLGPMFKNLEEGSEKEVKTFKDTGLYPNYIFENYITGANNRVAFAIAMAISDNPGKQYNPFFLYSAVGLGKTHLIQAIGNRILQNNPKVKVVYTTGESFANELIEAIQSGRGGKYSTNTFRNKYRNADVLLIDDIQFIAGRETTQEEFFHTFNALHMAGKQIVITSDRPPKDFTKLEARITSRFGSGMLADLQAPDLDVRVAILRSKRDREKIKVENAVIDFIAEKVVTNIRELEGAFIQVVSHAKTENLEVTKDLVAHVLNQSIKEAPSKPININDILKAVANYYSVKVVDIKGKRRTKEIVIPRQIAMYLIYDITGTPYMSIGELLGGRDHTTIIHGVQKMENQSARIPKIKQDIVNIKQVIQTS